MIVDASALIAVLQNEDDGDALLEQLLNQSTPLRMSVANYLECAIVVDARRNPVIERRFDELFRDLELVLEPVTVQQAVLARRAYRDFGRGSGHPAQLNFGDCFAYALALESREALLCKGNDFVHTGLELA